MYYPGRHRVSYNDGTFSAGDPRSPGLHWTAQHCTLQQQRSQSSLAIVQSNAPPTRLFEFPLTSSPSSVAAAPALPPLPFPTLQSPTEIPPRPGQCKPNLQETKWKSKIDAKFGDSWIRGTILSCPRRQGTHYNRTAQTITLLSLSLSLSPNPLHPPHYGTRRARHFLASLPCRPSWPAGRPSSRLQPSTSQTEPEHRRGFAESDLYVCIWGVVLEGGRAGGPSSTTANAPSFSLLLTHAAPASASISILPFSVSISALLRYPIWFAPILFPSPL